MDEMSGFLGKVEKSTRAKFSAKSEGMLTVAECEPAGIPDISEALLAEGAIFDSAFISAAKGGFAVHYLFRVQQLRRVLVLSASGKEFHSISRIIPAAVWDERKMQDLTGITIKGLVDSRPLIIHPEAGAPEAYPLAPKAKNSPKDIPREYDMPGTGEEGEFEIPVGPVHAGIIEPGHFRFHVVGERINKMETRMFFLHRGAEKAAEGKTLDEGTIIAEQISGDETVANSVAYCQAVESLAKMEVPERAQYLRVLLLELERIYSHLVDLGGMAMDIGFYMSSSRFILLREQMMRLNASFTGSRYLKGMCVPGGMSRDFDAATLSEIFRRIQGFNMNLKELREMTFNSSTFLDRTFATGIVPKEHGQSLAVVGPVARASNIPCDARVWLPYAAYGKMKVYEALGENGDVLSRFYVKISEVAESVGMILAALSALKGTEGPVRAPAPRHASIKGKIGFGWAEAPRGSCAFMVETDDEGKIARFACRTASFRNWRAIEKAVETAIVPDFPLVNKSFNLSYAGNDL